MWGSAGPLAAREGLEHPSSLAHPGARPPITPTPPSPVAHVHTGGLQNPTPPGDGCQGAWPSVYVDRVICKNVPLESSVPYRASDTVACPSVTRYTSGVKNWANVPNNERGFAQALLHNPFAIGISGNELQSYSSGVWNCGGNNPMNHAITVVGYTIGVRMSNGGRPSVQFGGGGWVAHVLSQSTRPATALLVRGGQSSVNALSDPPPPHLLSFHR